VNFIVWSQRVMKVEDLGIIDENAQMPAYTLLFVDHAKPNPWKATLKVFEQLGKGLSMTFKHAAPGVGLQRTGHADLHCAFLTLSPLIRGRETWALL